MGEESMISRDRRKRLDWASYCAGFDDAAEHSKWESLCPDPMEKVFTREDREFLKDLKISI